MVTVPSDYVRESAIRELGVAPERVVVVPHGYEPDLLVTRTPADELRAIYGLGDGPVVVYPAMSAPHKNHVFLVELMATVWSEPDLRLVFIGGSGLADTLAERCFAAQPPHQRPNTPREIQAGRGEVASPALIDVSIGIHQPLQNR